MTARRYVRPVIALPVAMIALVSQIGRWPVPVARFAGTAALPLLLTSGYHLIRRLARKAFEAAVVTIPSENLS